MPETRKTNVMSAIIEHVVDVNAAKVVLAYTPFMLPRLNTTRTVGIHAEAGANLEPEETRNGNHAPVHLAATMKSTADV